MPFGRRRGPAAASPSIEGFAQVGRGAALKGHLSGSGVLVVQGRLAGAVDFEGDVIVTRGGQLAEVRVKANRLRVEGEAEGRFRVDGSVEVIKGGELYGAVEARRLESFPGASFAGVVRIARGATAARRSAARG